MLVSYHICPHQGTIESWTATQNQWQWDTISQCNIFTGKESLEQKKVLIFYCYPLAKWQSKLGPFFGQDGVSRDQWGIEHSPLNIAVTRMLEISDRCFKAAIINMFQLIMVNTLEKVKNRKSQQNIKYKIKSKGNYRISKYNY